MGSLPLLAAVHGHVPPIVECTTRGWVRAPDLVPNALVEGDARVKISAECPAIDKVSLGLRFRERSFVKALRSREDVAGVHFGSMDFLFDSPWPHSFVSKSAQEAYEALLVNRDLWIIREEERTVFETTQPFSIRIKHHGVLRDSIEKFTILVPSTNFPPALRKMMIGVPREREILHVEWIYEYFFQISFSNGTTKDISAGYTAFQPQHDPASVIRGPNSATVELSIGGKHAENTLIASYSVEIIGDSSFTFFAGEKGRFLNVVVKRTGPARRFSAPLRFFAHITPVHSLKWAVEYDMSNDHVLPGLAEYALRDKQEASWWRPHYARKPISVTMPNSSLDEIQANKIVTTTSETFTIPVELHDTHVPDFETYYQTLSNALSVTLHVPRVVDEHVDPDDPHGEHEVHCGTESFENDEEAWVPWERSTFMRVMERAYSGRVPVVVHPADEATLSQRCLPAQTTALDQVIFSEDTICKRPSLTHYLVEGARGPTFLDRSAVPALLAEDPAQRALRAPILKPVINPPPDGEERINRYYIANQRSPIYVGETWAKKVAAKDKVVSAGVPDGGVLQYVELLAHA